MQNEPLIVLEMVHFGKEAEHTHNRSPSIITLREILVHLQETCKAVFMTILLLIAKVNNKKL